MNQSRVLAAAFAAAALLAACGGSDPGSSTPRVHFTRMVNFGDSLSDVGTYRTALVAANQSGLYSINGNFSKARVPGAPDGLPYTNWTQYLAAELDVTQPCAAETGLDSPSLADGGQLYFMAEAVTPHDTCFSYAQGGARVTVPYGPANRFFWDELQSPAGWLGQLTVPVATQVATFLGDNTEFASTDIVTVLAGGNDLFVDRALIVDAKVAELSAAGTLGTPEGQQAVRDAASAATAAMAQAGTELAALVTDQMLAKGAKYVVVVNLPDVSVTPDAKLSWNPGVGAVVNPLIGGDLTLQMVQAFNTALAAGLGVTGGESSHPEVAWVDAFTASQQQVASPATFGLTNVTEPACQLDTTQSNSTGIFLPDGTPVHIATSLFCTQNTLAVDVTSAMTYEFADTVHPTPYGYRLLAQLVSSRLAGKGWL